MTGNAGHWFTFLISAAPPPDGPRVFPSCNIREQQMDIHKPPVQQFLETWYAGDLDDDFRVTPHAYPSAHGWTTYLWSEVSQEKLFAHQLLKIYTEYLNLQGDHRSDRTARHLSSQLQKNPAYVQVCPDVTRRAGGKRFILKGHCDWQSSI